jgi:mannitol-1-phosphate/altronate dehydrogenase
MPSTYVGFGFGPIQTGLLLYEAVQSGGFQRFVVAEVDERLVDAVRAAGGTVTVNIAGRSGIHRDTLPKVELYNPRVPSDRRAIVQAIVEADEMGTAIPTVELYAAGGEASIAALLADGCQPGHPRIVYTAENHNYAAELLTKKVEERARGRPLQDLQCLNTVVGKMSGVVSSAEEMRRLGLAPLVPEFDKCVLVEEFNRILISKVTLPAFRRRIRVFEEKEDLLPFEEAKLYGHNAVHALLGFLARLRGYDVMSRIGDDESLMALGRRVFRGESGPALIRRHAATGDPLFTEAGYAAYGDDLLERMVNPWLFDRVDRIIRDPARKLGWDDRFFGTMRRALEAGLSPKGLALGAAAGVEYAVGLNGDPGVPGRDYLSRLWGDQVPAHEREACLRLVETAAPLLEEWRS